VGGGGEWNGASLDGTGWTQVPTGTSQNLAAVFGFGPDDVRISGTNTLLRWDGAALHAVPNQPGGLVVVYNGMWGPSPDEVYLLGGVADQVWRWTPDGFTPLDAGHHSFVHRIAGAGNRIWISGTGGIVSKRR
jgi:hypothetical protein